jgi:hypothetical protein
METLFNKEQITYITISDKTPWPFIHYVERRKYFLFGEKVSGFLYYDDPFFLSKLKTKTEIESNQNNILVVGNIAYEKPKAVIELTSGTTHEKYFNTIEEAESYGTDHKKLWRK